MLDTFLIYGSWNTQYCIQSNGRLNAIGLQYIINDGELLAGLQLSHWRPHTVLDHVHQQELRLDNQCQTASLYHHLHALLLLLLLLLSEAGCWHDGPTGCAETRGVYTTGGGLGAKPCQSYRLAPPKIMSRSPPKSRNSLGVLALQTCRLKSQSLMTL